jgi:signal transduction histidine kinase
MLDEARMLELRMPLATGDRRTEPAISEPVNGASAVRLPSTRLGVPTWAAIRPRLWMLAVAVSAILLTVVWQVFSVSVRTLSGRIMVDTATGLVGALACFVFVQRTRCSRDVRDLLIAIGFGVFSASDLIAAASATFAHNPAGGWRWLILAAGLLAGSILILAAVFPGLRPQAPRPPRLGVLAEARGDGAGSERDGQQRFIVAGLIVLIVGWSTYLLVPFPSGGRLYAGDILKLGAYVLILCGCLTEIRAVQGRQAQQVAVDERRRMARDMHDGLAQELAFIASYSQRLDRNGRDGPTVSHLQAAAERALHDSRTTIAVLTSPPDAPLALLITRTAESFRSRFGVQVGLDLDPSLVVDAERRNAVLRILHESLTNAIRHGSARHISVRMAGGSRHPALTIADDGSGFDVAAALRAGKGLGLTSMRERAEMLGGHLSVISGPGRGTVVEVGLS